MTPQMSEDYTWVNTDPEIEKKYPGQMVVPYRKQIIGHGTYHEAMEQAKQYMTSIGKPDEGFFLIEILDPNARWW